jgi:hypothetical protein
MRPDDGCALLPYFTLSNARRFYLSSKNAAPEWVNQTICSCILAMAMHPTLFFLLCLTPDDSARQEESAVTQWVNLSYSIPINIEFACVMLL